ncbi:MAG: PepSY domain-containing protein [Hyphomonas sp.]|uniref:PepSY domain-containing protein n=1 Tax=Hyphomonas sp. TaxID=87 RepID=UPI0017A83D00|nr:PepSY domain-containing protein [Hyphomonas sp.]MBA3069235.1 PepSY domain-containing protein [Hyphomonas sp.]MBU3919651.1 PepSY domain-containing protein [Alphaproteobacteria bacterium]MBU4061818.1 PepSY domain-containing protein [Alphaproteobacteria bacterium]MBU4163350.1 PepSY domain-containing protein [Alphaproteobacteria bacterium]
MKSVFKLAVLAAAVSFAPAAFASPECTKKPQSEWLTQEQMKEIIAKMDFKAVKVFQISGSCYEVYAHTKDGHRAEIYFNPVTGKVVEKNVD